MNIHIVSMSWLLCIISPWPWNADIPEFISFKKTQKWIVGLYGSSLFNFWKNLHTVSIVTPLTLLLHFNIFGFHTTLWRHTAYYNTQDTSLSYNERNSWNNLWHLVAPMYVPGTYLVLHMCNVPITLLLGIITSILGMMTLSDKALSHEGLIW